VPIIIIGFVDKPPPPPPPLPTTPIEKESDDDDGDSDIFEDAPQTPSDMVDIPGREEMGKPEEEHFGAHYPLVTSTAI